MTDTVENTHAAESADGFDNADIAENGDSVESFESGDPGAILFGHAVARSPQATYDRMRRTCPVARSDFNGSGSV